MLHCFDYTTLQHLQSKTEWRDHFPHSCTGVVCLECKDIKNIVRLAWKIAV